MLFLKCALLQCSWKSFLRTKRRRCGQIWSAKVIEKCPIFSIKLKSDQMFAWQMSIYGRCLRWRNSHTPSYTYFTLASDISICIKKRCRVQGLRASRLETVSMYTRHYLQIRLRTLGWFLESQPLSVRWSKFIHYLLIAMLNLCSFHSL